MVKDIVFISVIVLALLAPVGGLIWFSLDQEAKVFNKFSDAKASAWDAMFIEFRVEACRNN